MAGNSGLAASQSNKQEKRKWRLTEDSALVSCMMELRTLGTHNADTGFKSGYLPELERMLAEKLPNCGLKARPHIESRLKTLKKDCSVKKDYRPNTSGFGWDDTRKMVTAEDEVWDAYIASHKDAAQFRNRSFNFFEELSQIYAKDRATGKGAQAAEDILEEINLEDQETQTDEQENLNEFDNADTPISTDIPPDVPPIASTIGTSSIGRKRKRNESNSLHITEAMNNMTTEMKEALRMLSESVHVHTDILQEKLLALPAAIRDVDGLTSAERRHAIRKFGNEPNQVLLFFGTDPSERLEMVKDFLANG